MTTVADAALAYSRKGWKPVPVDRKTKKAIGKGWQKRPFSPEQFNGNAINVAIQFGKVSGGLVDVDLDNTLAIGLAPEFLPKTGTIFGHRSKPCSHQLYVSNLCDTEKGAAIQFKDASGAVIVELRVGANDKGAATVFPPSMHVTGEMVQWSHEGEPAHVDGAGLKRAVLELAVCCLLHPHYPGQGSRHEGALVLGGFLARNGWTAGAIEHLVEVLARAATDDDVRDRVEAAASAVNVKSNGHDVAGFTRLAEVWGEDVAKVLGKWLGGPRERRADNGHGGFEDDVALGFAAQHADNFRYVAASSQWMRWSAARWLPEETLAAFDEARTLCRQGGNAQAKTVAAVERLARTDRRIAASTEQWDAEANGINTPTAESNT
jgi:hypothetical protein